MFESLSDRLSLVFSKLTRTGLLTESNVDEALREVRRALLEADVALPVVKDFLEKVREKAVGEEVVKSVSPGQTVIKIVNDQLTDLLGSENVELNLKVSPPAILMVVGLQVQVRQQLLQNLLITLKINTNKKLLWPPLM